MTWLFTQVWLWSSASFVVGSLFTWLLFVRPLRKKLRSLENELPVRELPENVHEEPERAEATALDLLSEPPEEPAIGDWDRGPRSWSPRPPEAPSPDRTAAAPTGAGEPRAEPAEWEIPDWADEDTEVRRIPPYAELPTEREVPVESEHGGRELDGHVPAGPEPDRGAPTPAEPHVPERAPVDGSTWFQKPDIDEPEWSGELPTEEPPAGRPGLSSRLRSLFEPLGDPDPEAARVDSLDLEATQNIPRIEEPPKDAEQAPLPRRTPGVGPRPGAQNLNSVAARARQQQEEEEAQQQPESHIAQQPDDHTIKGHFASRQYHTPDSPQYERIVAEVWFRTTEDAEQAGFEAWDARTT